MALIEVRQRVLRVEILIVLRHDRAARAERRGVVHRFGERVGGAEAEAARHPALNRNARQRQQRPPAGRLPDERLHTRDAQRPVRIAVRRAQQVQARAARAGVSRGDRTRSVGTFASDGRVPRLNHAQPVAGIDAEVVRRVSVPPTRPDSSESGILKRTGIRLGFGKRRLADQLLRDRGVRRRVVCDAVARVEHRTAARSGTPCRPLGPTLFQSVRIKLRGELVPDCGPVWPGVTTLAAVKLGVTSRFAMRPLASMYGNGSSHRTPRLSVIRELRCQLSSRYTLKVFCRNRVTPPTCSVACCGIPSRKSAMSAPVSRAIERAVARVQSGERVRAAGVGVAPTRRGVAPELDTDRIMCRSTGRDSV